MRKGVIKMHADLQVVPYFLCNCTENSYVGGGLKEYLKISRAFTTTRDAIVGRAWTVDQRPMGHSREEVLTEWGKAKSLIMVRSGKTYLIPDNQL